MDVILETPRLLLRRFTRADVDLIVELDSDPEVMRYISGGVPTPRVEIETDKGYATEDPRALIARGFMELGVRRVFASTMRTDLGESRLES